MGLSTPFYGRFYAFFPVAGFWGFCKIYGCGFDLRASLGSITGVGWHFTVLGSRITAAGSAFTGAGLEFTVAGLLKSEPPPKKFKKTAKSCIQHERNPAKSCNRTEI